jgi:hypothetical protein
VGFAGSGVRDITHIEDPLLASIAAPQHAPSLTSPNVPKKRSRGESPRDARRSKAYGRYRADEGESAAAEMRTAPVPLAT